MHSARASVALVGYRQGGCLSLQPEAVSRIEHELVMAVDGVTAVVRSACQMEYGCRAR